MRPGIVFLSVCGISVISLIYFIVYTDDRSGPVEIKSVAGLRKFTKGKNFYVIGYFENQDSAEAQFYKQAVVDGDVKEMTYGITSDAAELGFPEVEYGVMLAYDSRRTVFKTEQRWTKSAIKRWIEGSLWSLTVAAHTTTHAPLVTEFKPSSNQSEFYGSFSNCMFLLASKSSPDFPNHLETFTAVAKQFRGRTRYVFVNTDDVFGAVFARSFFPYNPANGPAVYTRADADLSFQGYLPGVTTIDAESIAKYNDELLSKMKQILYRTEEIPEDWDSKPVKELVGKNFNEVIKSSGKSVFVFFYAPWSPYCKNIYPAWKQLGEAFADSNQVMIARIHTGHHTNQIIGLPIQSQPSFMFFPAGSNEAIKYEGGRSVEEFTTFVDEHIDRIGKEKKQEEEQRFEL